MIVCASNTLTLRTKAAIDFSDGEVIVDHFVPCKVDEFIQNFKMSVGVVLQHAAMIQRAVRVIRNLLSPEQTPAPRTLEKLLAALNKQLKSKDAEKSESDVVEEMPL
jgi:hypothetical protein